MTEDIDWGFKCLNDNLSWSFTRLDETLQGIISELGKPHRFLRPELFRDGNKWCALYGADLQAGIAGFGDSPADAIEAFNREYIRKIDPTGGRAAGRWGQSNGSQLIADD